MNIFAADPAVHFGWAHTLGMSGVWNLSVRADESKGMRLIRLRAKLTEVFESLPVDLCVYEIPRSAPKRQGALIVQAELIGVLKVCCEDHKIEYKGYNPTEIKKFATGKGNASKEAMVDAACNHFKRVFDDTQHDEVDALWLLELTKKDFH